MENFFYTDDFYPSLEELIEHLEETEVDAIEELPDDYEIEVSGSTLTPVIELTPQLIFDAIVDGVDFSEDNEESEADRLLKAITESFNAEKFSKLVPKLYYENHEKHIITKQDLLDYTK